jgi:hypothetical protein
MCLFIDIPREMERAIRAHSKRAVPVRASIAQVDKDEADVSSTIQLVNSVPVFSGRVGQHAVGGRRGITSPIK